MSQSTITRVATPDDAQELARLNLAFNGASEPAENLAERLSDPRRVETPILAERDNRLVGFAGVRIVPCEFYPTPHAELTELYVEPAYRRQGVGRALAAHAERLAQGSGATELFVLTGFENQAAQGLYRAMGYCDHDLALCKAFNPSGRLA